MNQIHERMKGYAEQGLTIFQVADIEEISYNAVRARCRRAGVKLTHESAKTIRNRAYDMKPVDAIEFLLAIIEEAEALEERSLEMSGLEKSMSVSQRKLFRIFHGKLGKVIQHDALYSALYSDNASGEMPAPDIIKVFISHLRKAIKGQFEIKIVWGEGYYMVECEGPK